jgi:hypothetical protein
MPERGFARFLSELSDWYLAFSPALRWLPPVWSRRPIRRCRLSLRPPRRCRSRSIGSTCRRSKASAGSTIASPESFSPGGDAYLRLACRFLVDKEID